MKKKYKRKRNRKREIEKREREREREKESEREIERGKERKAVNREERTLYQTSRDMFISNLKTKNISVNLINKFVFFLSVLLLENSISQHKFMITRIIFCCCLERIPPLINT